MLFFFGVFVSSVFTAAAAAVVFSIDFIVGIVVAHFYEDSTGTRANEIDTIELAKNAKKKSH